VWGCFALTNLGRRQRVRRREEERRDKEWVSVGGMSNFSDDLGWEVTKRWSSYKVGNKVGPALSRDPLNVTGRYQRKYHGPANSRAIGINPNPDKKGQYELCLKGRDAGRKPKAIHRVGLNVHGKGKARTRKVVDKIVGEKYYRHDISREAKEKLEKAIKYQSKRAAHTKFKVKERSNKTMTGN